MTAALDGHHDGRRPSLEKAPIVIAARDSTPSAFDRLPDEIIEQ